MLMPTDGKHELPPGGPPGLGYRKGAGRHRQSRGGVGGYAAIILHVAGRYSRTGGLSFAGCAKKPREPGLYSCKLLVTCS